MRLGKFIRWELYKNLSNRLILILLAVVLFANGLILVSEIRAEDENGVSDVDVSAFYQAHRGESYTELLVALAEDDALKQALYADIAQQSSYHDYLEQVESQAQRIFSSGVLAVPGSYSYRLAEKTLTAYQKLESLELTADDPTGIQVLSENQMSLCFLLFLVILVGVQLFIPELENGQICLLRPTRDGKWELFASKFITLLLFVLGFLALVWLENGLICRACGLSFGDLSRPLQSVNGYLTSAYPMTALEYLFTCFGVNFLLLALAGLVTAAFCLILENAVAVYFVVALIGGLEYILYSMISVHNPLAVLHQVNLFSALTSSQWFSEFQCVNLFGYPIQVFPVVAIAMTAGSLIFVALSILIWNRPTLNMKLFQVGRRFSGVHRARNWKPSLILHEGRKILRECNGLLLLVVLVVIQLFYYSDLTLDTGMDEFYYIQYSNELEGELTDEKSEYVTDERTFFDTLEDQIQEYRDLVLDGTITENYGIYEISILEEDYQRNAGFALAETQYRYLERQQEQGYSVTYLYSSGYNLLLDNETDDMASAALLAFFIILVFSSVFSMEKRNHMPLIVSCTGEGHRKALQSKAFISALTVMIAFMICWGWKLIRVMQVCGLSGWNCGARSLPQFALAPHGFSVLGWFLMVMAVRLISALVVLAIVMLLSYTTGNQITTIAISMLIFVIPILFSMMGLTGEFPWISILSGHIMMA